MIILIPMNGEGKRFRDAGYTTWKPFLPVNGLPLIRKVLQYLPATQQDSIHIISRLEHMDQVSQEIGKGVYGLYVNTRGPAETALMWLLKNEGTLGEELLIADCDSFFEQPAELQKALSYFRSMEADGGVTVRESTDPECSYASLLGARVTETRERDPISTWSTTGPYWFKRAGDFRWAAQHGAVDGIHTVSPLYNYMIKLKHQAVFSYQVNTFRHLGTPALYEEYVKSLR